MRLRHALPRLAACATALASLCAASGDAHAQTTRRGWALNRYEPAPMGDAFFLAEHPWYSSTRLFSAGLVADYAINPLAIDRPGTDDVDAIDSMFVLHVGAQVSFLDRVGIHLSLPVSLSQSGSTTANDVMGAAVLPASGPAIGDLRAGLRVRLFGHADRDVFSLHLGANFWAPIGSPESNMGDGSIRIEPRLTLAGRGGPIRWSFGGGFMIRSQSDVANLAFGNEIRLAAAVGLVLADDRLRGCLRENAEDFKRVAAA